MSKRNCPLLAVDVIIECFNDKEEFQGIVLIERKYEPKGLAIPGGHVDYGETLEAAAKREGKEETSLDIEILDYLGYKDDPNRDPRYHIISHVFRCKAYGIPEGKDDAKKANIYSIDNIPSTVFDHDKILKEYIEKYHS